MNKLSVDMRVCIGARKDTNGSKKKKKNFFARRQEYPREIITVFISYTFFHASFYPLPRATA